MTHAHAHAHTHTRTHTRARARAHTHTHTVGIGIHEVSVGLVLNDSHLRTCRQRCMCQISYFLVERKNSGLKLFSEFGYYNIIVILIIYNYNINIIYNIIYYIVYK